MHDNAFEGNELPNRNVRLLTRLPLGVPEKSHTTCHRASDLLFFRGDPLSTKVTYADHRHPD